MQQQMTQPSRCRHGTASHVAIGALFAPFTSVAFPGNIALDRVALRRL